MKKQRCLGLTVLFLMFAGAKTAPGCIWDSDTLAMEKARFPGYQDIMTGNFPRHSKAFYEWRVKRCQAILAKDRTQVAVYDDLAVAQHKLGDHRAAIGTMQEKDLIKPGLYETFSNLGTFYIYTGELKEALVWIDKALAINPNAHFGREKYQKWLVEWILEGKPGPEGTRAMFEPAGFAGFILRKQEDGNKDPATPAMIEKRLTEARTGVLGMMRFADFDNPLLQEVLGDILCSGGFKRSAGHLGVQSYLLAVRKDGLKEDNQRLLQKITTTGNQHESFDRASTIADLEAARAKSAALTAQVAKDEAIWIAAGKDAAAEFTAKYLKTAPVAKSR